ncbi:MAG: chorismate mutase [Elusimicrobiales bacterium]|nr:chorismate mutase [Elusimicrobiales bacterium]
MKKKSLEDFRRGIDLCDVRIAELLSQRLCIARDIGKSRIKPSVCDPAREQQVLANVKHSASPEFAPFIEEIFKEIIKQSRKVQE